VKSKIVVTRQENKAALCGAEREKSEQKTEIENLSKEENKMIGIILNFLFHSLFGIILLLVRMA
jgi:hypothetical protein